jgi:UDP-glucose 4-epimerase
VNRVIITGGNGFIGRHLVKKVLSSKIQCVVVLSNSSNNPEGTEFSRDERLTFYSADIRQSNKIRQVMEDVKPDTCIHLAAKVSVPESIKNPDETMEINVQGTQNVLEACRKSQVSNFIFASSAAVYGDTTELPISEVHPLRPLSPYGISKMLSERHVSNYGKLRKIQNTISLRIFNVYGSGQSSETDVISKFGARLSNGLPPVIYGKGIHTRDFVSVDDVADGILLSVGLAERCHTDIDLTSPLVFNIGTGRPTSIKYIALKMIQLFALDIQPAYEKEKGDDGVILHSYADITRARETLNFVPKKTIDAGLVEIIKQNYLKSDTTRTA